MTKPRRNRLVALLLLACLTMPLSGCLDGGSGGSDSGGSTPATITLTTNDTGQATYNGQTITLVDELGQTLAKVELSVDKNTGLVEVVSPQYTYNTVEANPSGGTVVFTQKVDTPQTPWKSETLDSECPAFTEDIGSPALTKPAGLAKPTPKKLSSSNGKAATDITKMTLTKDITVALTPYNALTYIPMADHIATQIGATQVTVLAGADINISDSTGKPTTAEAACFTGTISFQASNELAPHQTLVNASTGNNTVLIVFKNKKWQRVNAQVSYDEGTSTFTIHNAPASLRLYPFLFVQAPATNLFTVQGTVQESVYPEPPSPILIAGATVTASLPQVLNNLTVDNTAGTITIGGSGEPKMFDYNWQLFPMPNGTTDFTTNLLANVSAANSSTSTGTATFTVDSQVKNLMTTDGQYLLQVNTTYSPFSEQQTGLIIRNGSTFTIQMNPAASSALSTTSGTDGTFALPGLLTAYKQNYTLTTTKTGYTGYPQTLGGTISNGVLVANIWLQKSYNDKLNGTYAFVSAGNGTSGMSQQWWTSYGNMVFDGTGGWTETFDASFNDGSMFQGTLPKSGTGHETYSVSSATYLSLSGSDIPYASGGIDTLGTTGVVAFSSPTQREPVFFAKRGSGYNYSTDLMGSDWFFVSYNPASFYGGHDRLSFGSTGFTSPSFHFVPASGPISLTPNGTFTLAATDSNGSPLASPHDCSLNAGHTLALCGQVKTANQPVTVAGVRLAAANTYTLGSVAGTFHVAGVVRTSAITQTRQGGITFDGMGGWTANFNTSDNVTSNGYYNASGTYSYDPASPGRYTLTETSPSSATLYCGVSSDMNTAVCHIANDPNTLGIYMGVRAPQTQAP